MAKRKQILTDDRVTINIDTFHDHIHAYWFDVNPYAIQLDGITTDGVGDDFSWEGLWYSEAKITEDGYVVLITIPFKTLRFPDDQKQNWGVMLGRFIQRNNEFSMWPYITRRKLPQFRRAIRHYGRSRGHFTGPEHPVHSLRTRFGSALPRSAAPSFRHASSPSPPIAPVWTPRW